MDIYCNECKGPLLGRKGGRRHGELSGHEWQPLFHCRGCKGGFKKNKLYEEHLSSCTSGTVVKPQPTTLAATPAKPIIITPKLRLSANAKPSVLSHPVTVVPIPPVVSVQHVDVSNTSDSKLNAVCTLDDRRATDTTPSESKPEAHDFDTDHHTCAACETAILTGTFSDKHALFNHPPYASSVAEPSDSLPSQVMSGGAGRLGFSNNDSAGLERPRATPGATASKDDRKAPDPDKSTATTTLSWHCRSCLQDPCRDPVATICGHIFCTACIIGRVQDSGACPVCGKTFFVKLDVWSAV
ncbi:hypothetical protein C8Q78DRAFT_1020973 [Trametes maxima]|nr:hypothetical protein C8Q78DRAFT_1020973 [Trametes maxima]